MAAQVVMISALSFILRKKPAENKHASQVLLWCSGTLVAIYYLGWVFYYFGIFSPWLVMVLTLAPALAFCLVSCRKRNGPALVASLVFLICHTVFAVVNFIA